MRVNALQRLALVGFHREFGERLKRDNDLRKLPLQIQYAHIHFAHVGSKPATVELVAQAVQHLRREVHACHRDARLHQRQAQPPGPRHQFQHVAPGAARLFDEKRDVRAGRDEGVVQIRDACVMFFGHHCLRSQVGVRSTRCVWSERANAD